jgi:predicted ATP-dependent serine protease
MRAISCFTGMTREEIIQEKNMAQRVWSEIKDNISMFDTVDWSMEDIDAHCEKHRPDIIVIDQLDKVNVTGTYARTDEKLRQIYTSAREIAKRRDCAVMQCHKHLLMHIIEIVFHLTKWKTLKLVKLLKLI